MNCYLCDTPQQPQISLLVCKCYCCNKCYNNLKLYKINNNVYSYYQPDSYNDMKLYQRQMKRIREKIRACEAGGCYYGKVTKQGKPDYSDYKELLSFLETLLKEKQVININSLITIHIEYLYV